MSTETWMLGALCVSQAGMWLARLKSPTRLHAARAAVEATMTRGALNEGLRGGREMHGRQLEAHAYTHGLLEEVRGALRALAQKRRRRATPVTVPAASELGAALRGAEEEPAPITSREGRGRVDTIPSAPEVTP